MGTATGGTLKGKVLTYALQLERAGEGFFICVAKGGGSERGTGYNAGAITQSEEGINGSSRKLD